jgi:hypothetical protein
MKDKAQRFAEKYAGYDQADAIRAVTDRCEALLR